MLPDAGRWKRRREDYTKEVYQCKTDKLQGRKNHYLFFLKSDFYLNPIFDLNQIFIFCTSK